MLKSSLGLSSKAAAKSLPLVVFTVSGHRLAAKAEEIGGVFRWPGAMPIPSGTRFIAAVIRRGEELFPVFDLAARLGLSGRDEEPFGLIAKHREGPIAISIDAMPSLHVTVPSNIQPSTDWLAHGRCEIDGADVPVLDMSRVIDPDTQRTPTS
jgi:chemotaxis signal transduction protein